MTWPLIISGVWALGCGTVAAAPPRWSPVPPSIQQRHKQDVILAANKDGNDRDCGVSRSVDLRDRGDRRDSGSRPVQKERSPVERPQTNQDSDRDRPKASRTGSSNGDSVGKPAKERSKGRKRSDEDSGERSRAGKGHREERERANEDVERLAAEWRQADYEVTLRAADLALAEERYRTGQITKKELERARAAYENARQRAADARQFYTAAQARLIDLDKRAAP